MMSMLESRITPSLADSTLTVSENFFHVGCEVRVELGALPLSSSWTFAGAMHSEIVRRTGSAACNTTTGRASCSITISAPLRTRSRRAGKSFAASAPEM